MNINNSTKFSEEREIESAYIITIRNNEISETMAKRCIDSCNSVGMPYKVWEAFDGTGNDLKIPKKLQDKEYIYWLKQVNCRMSPTQIAVFYSHYSLWCHCITIDKPIVILEHDAVMVKPYKFHKYYNCIEFLGCEEQAAGVEITPHIPPHGTIYDRRWRFLCRAHAYAIDPSIARNMVSYVIREGIVKTLDVALRADIFGIVQNDMYAYDLRGESTIKELEGKHEGFGYTEEM
jgi:hypothetical protein